MIRRVRRFARSPAALILAFALLWGTPPALALHGNLLANGDFSKGNAGWGVYTEPGGTGAFSAADGKGVLTVTQSSNLDYAVQLYCGGFKLEAGGKYRLAFAVTSSLSRRITARIQLNGGDYRGYCQQEITLPAGERTAVQIDFTMTEKSDPAPRLCFNCGTPAGVAPLATHTLTFENVEVFLMDGTGIVKQETGRHAPAILVNQVGYLPGAQKTAVFRDGALSGTFTVADETGKTVFSGTMTQAAYDAPSGDTVATGDFTALSAPGVYRVRAGGQESFPFAVDGEVYGGCFLDVFRFFYYQRCGTALSSHLAGAFAHGACHTGLAAVYGTGEKKEVSGGWHDAGDYGRYVVPAAKTAADLLLSYEAAPSLFGDDMDIPESGNGIPDVLDEVRFELDWMLKMQEEATGGVYHKVTCANFPGTVMPEYETAPLILTPVSLTATGDFAAAMALAARVYQTVDVGFSGTCLAAAEKAWAYLAGHQNAPGGFKNPDGIVTGEYGDGSDLDERYWAACELFRATGKAEYQTYADGVLSSHHLSGLGWADVGTYGHLAYMGCGEKATPASTQKIRAQFLKEAEALLQSADGYGNTLGMDYPWGSSMSMANNAMRLLFAADLFPERAAEFRAAAGRHLDYLMGANPTGYCYITGQGTLFTDHPHHRPSQAAKQTVPGMLAGGPDAGLHDPYAANVLKGLSPAKCYVDNDQSYSTNEVAIYWNSPLLYLLSRMLTQ